MSFVFLQGWEADAKVWRKLVCNAAGKLIIDPSEIFEEVPTNNEVGKAPTSNWAFDHKADASAHHVKYTDAEARAAVGYNGTKYWSCPGIHFDALNPDVSDITKNSSGYIIIDAGDVNIIAQVSLPHGAVLSSAVARGNAGAASKYWTLERITLTDKTKISIASANINTSHMGPQYLTVDNTLYGYYIITTPLAATDEVYGAMITYTI